MAGLTFASSPEIVRLYWAEADAFAQSLRNHLLTCPSIKQLEIAGSYRRGKETVGDLDILVESDNPSEVVDRLAALCGNRTNDWSRRNKDVGPAWPDSLQVDLRIVPAESFGAALQYFTGSKEHNVILRGLAKDRGLKVNEYGVFRIRAMMSRPARMPESISPVAPKPMSMPRSISRCFRPSCAKHAGNLN